MARCAGSTGRPDLRSLTILVAAIIGRGRYETAALRGCVEQMAGRGRIEGWCIGTISF